MHTYFNHLIMWVNPKVVRSHVHMKWNRILQKETPNEIIHKVWFFIYAIRLGLVILNLLIDSNSHTLTIAHLILQGNEFPPLNCLHQQKTFSIVYTQLSSSYFFIICYFEYTLYLLMLTPNMWPYAPIGFNLHHIFQDMKY
jgi:hypothetical protein